MSNVHKKGYISWPRLIQGLGFTFGVATIALAIMAFRIHGLGEDGLLLSAVGIGAGWLRFRLAPTGFLSLSPIAFFLALLVVHPYTAYVVAMISVIFGSVVFRRQGWHQSLADMAVEGVCVVLSLTAYVRAQTILRSQQTFTELIWPYLVAVVVYVLVRLALDLARATVTEGVGTGRFLTGTAKSLAANFLLFAAISLGVRISVYDNYGYLGLVLVTIALVELYHPWKLLSEQDDILFANLAMVAQAIDIKDPYTAKHSRNVADIAVRVARAMRLPENEVRKIRIGALMHDIGKIGVSGAIIRKPTRLDADEELAMRSHPVISADLMQPIELLADAAEIVRHHHEHCDGSGYPSGLRGQEIPVGSRVILVADAFDAMVTDRPYRRGRSKEEALKVLREHSGRQFDSKVVASLESIIHLL